MITFKVMNRTGHTTLAFDERQTMDAEEKFKEIMGKGYMAVAKDDTGGMKAYKAFDPSIEETVFRPPLMGG